MPKELVSGGVERKPTSLFSKFTQPHEATVSPESVTEMPPDCQESHGLLFEFLKGRSVRESQLTHFFIFQVNVFFFSLSLIVFSSFITYSTTLVRACTTLHKESL